MTGSVNHVILVGHVGRDPEIRSTQDGTKIANFPLATSETWKDRNSGEKRERTEWSRIVVFNENLVRLAEQYIRKGSHIYLEGSLQTRKWTDQSGQERYSTEVVLQKYRGEITLLGSKSDSQSGGYGERPASARDQQTAGYGGGYGAQGDSFQDDSPPF